MTNGGPSTDIFKKALGEEKQHIYSAKYCLEQSKGNMSKTLSVEKDMDCDKKRQE